MLPWHVYLLVLLLAVKLVLLSDMHLTYSFDWRLHKATTRSVLEYTAPVWHISMPIYLSRHLEHVLRRKLRILYENGPYCAHLETAGLTTLPECRLSLCETFYTKTNKPGHKLYSVCYPLRGSAGTLCMRTKGGSGNFQSARNVIRSVSCRGQYGFSTDHHK